MGLKQGIPDFIAAYTIDSAHSPGYGVGYLTNIIQPRLAMATHFSFDHELIGEAIAEVRNFWKGMFTFGLDNTVVNVTKEGVWICEAAVPDTANTTKPNPQWMVQELFGGVLSEEISFPPPAHTVPDVQEQAVRDFEITPEKFTPPGMMRKWVREWPTGIKFSPATLMGGKPGGPPPANQPGN